MPPANASTKTRSRAAGRSSATSAIASELGEPIDMARVERLLKSVKKAARQYRALTGRPLGVTGEIAEFEACRLLDLRPAVARQAGYDAVRVKGRRTQKVQVKGRVVFAGTNRSQRVGAIRLDHEWDTTVLVLMAESFEPLAIYEAKRPAIEKALGAPGSKARNDRGQMAVSQFKSIATVAWSRSQSG